MRFLLAIVALGGGIALAAATTTTTKTTATSTRHPDTTAATKTARTDSKDASVDKLNDQLLKIQDRIIVMRKQSTSDVGAVKDAKRDQDLNAIQVQFDDAMKELSDLQHGTAANASQSKDTVRARIASLQKSLSRVEAE